MIWGFSEIQYVFFFFLSGDYTMVNVSYTNVSTIKKNLHYMDQVYLYARRPCPYPRFFS